jgi:hypothetical protein
MVDETRRRVSKKSPRKTAVPSALFSASHPINQAREHGRAPRRRHPSRLALKLPVNMPIVSTAFPTLWLFPTVPPT